jgi:hypothetical protein
MLAIELQNMLGVEDCFVIASGFFNTPHDGVNTLYWFFSKGSLYRVAVRNGKVVESRSTELIKATPRSIFSWQVDCLSDNCTHPLLYKMLVAFSEHTSFTPGWRRGSITENMKSQTNDLQEVLERNKLIF